MSEATRVELSITPPDGAIIDGWALYTREPGTVAWTARGHAMGGTAVLHDLPSRGELEIGLAPLRAGVEAPEALWTILPYRIGTEDFTVPSSVANFRAAQSGNHVLLAWDAVTVEQLSHYEIRIGSSWDNGVPVAKVPAPLTHHTTGVWYTGSQTYWIRPYTHQGLTAASAASAVVSVQADQYEPVQGTVSESGGGFTGTKSGLEVSGGNLRITKLPAAATDWTNAANTYTHPAYLPHLGSGTYVTAWVDRGSVVDERVEVSVAAEHAAETIPASAWTMPLREAGLDPGENSIADRLLPSGIPLSGLDLTVEIDTAQDGTPTPDGYRFWIPGAVYRYRQYRLRITLRSIGLLTPRITTLIHRTRRRNLKDEAEVTIGATGGTDVTWTTAFTAAPKVTAAVIGTAARVAVVSNVSASGCKVRVFADDGTEQSSGTVHVHALGI